MKLGESNTPPSPALPHSSHPHLHLFLSYSSYLPTPPPCTFCLSPALTHLRTLSSFTTHNHPSCPFSLPPSCRLSRTLSLSHLHPCLPHPSTCPHPSHPLSLPPEHPPIPSGSGMMWGEVGKVLKMHSQDYFPLLRMSRSLLPLHH